MKHYSLTAAIMLLTTIGLLSCDKDPPGTPSAPARMEMGFVHSINIGDNTYVSIFKDMSVGSLNTDNVLVMPEDALSLVYKGEMYITDIEYIYKYAQKEGKLVQGGNVILLPSGVAAMYTIFASGYKTYASCHGLGKVIIVSSTTMEKARETNLTEYSLGKAAGDSDPGPAASVIRGGALYVAFSWMKSTYICEVGVYVALIDTETDKPTKVVNDPHILTASNELPADDPFIDEKGDICFHYVAMFGYQPGVKEGFLCIEKDQTDFDKSYCFTLASVNLTGVKGNKTLYAYVKVYGGNGKVHTYFNIPGAASNPPDYVHGRCFQPFGTNLYNKSCTKLDPSATAGWTVALYRLGSDIIFGMSTDQGMGYSIYHPATATYEVLEVKIFGASYAVHELRQSTYISNPQKEQ